MAELVPCKMTKKSLEPWLQSVGSEFQTSPDFEWLVVGLQMVWMVWNMEPQSYEIRTNSRHFVWTLLVLETNVRIVNGPVFKWLGP